MSFHERRDQSLRISTFLNESQHQNRTISKRFSHKSSLEVRKLSWLHKQGVWPRQSSDQKPSAQHIARLLFSSSELSHFTNKSSSSQWASTTRRPYWEGLFRDLCSSHCCGCFGGAIWWFADGCESRPKVSWDTFLGLLITPLLVGRPMLQCCFE